MHYRHTHILDSISVADCGGLEECKCVQERSVLVAGDPALGPGGPYLQQGERVAMQTLAEEKQSEELDCLPACL